jgi:hypothetical protein
MEVRPVSANLLHLETINDTFYLYPEAFLERRRLLEDPNCKSDCFTLVAGAAVRLLLTPQVATFYSSVAPAASVIVLKRGEFDEIFLKFLFGGFELYGRCLICINPCVWITVTKGRAAVEAFVPGDDDRCVVSLSPAVTEYLAANRTTVFEQQQQWQVKLAFGTLKKDQLGLCMVRRLHGDVVHLDFKSFVKAVCR